MYIYFIEMYSEGFKIMHFVLIFYLKESNCFAKLVAYSKDAVEFQN